MRDAFCPKEQEATERRFWLHRLQGDFALLLCSRIRLLKIVCNKGAGDYVLQTPSPSVGNRPEQADQ